MPLSALGSIGNFWEGVGTLVRLRHVDARVVYDAIGNAARYWWALTQKDTLLQRDRSEASDLMQNFEWLAGVFADFATRDGTRADFSFAGAVQDLDAQISAWEDRLEMLEATRTVRMLQARR